MLLVSWILFGFAAPPAPAVQLKAETAAAFDRYVRATEARMDDDVRDDQFLAIDALPEPRRRAVYAQLQRGEIFIEPLRTLDDDHQIHIPSGLLHHWAGVIFIPHATISDALAVLEDYNNQDTFKPVIRRSKLIEREGDQSKIFLQFLNKAAGTVVINAEFDVSDTQFGSSRYQIASRSTRIVELADPDGPDEHELPVGRDHGYMWRLDTYWRIEQKDGGVYVQNESIALTRTVPILLAWLINPLVKSIPRNSLMNLLNSTRKAVLKSMPPSKESISRGAVATSG